MNLLFLLRHVLYTELSLNLHEVVLIIIINVTMSILISFVFGAIALFFMLGQMVLIGLILINLYESAAIAAKSIDKTIKRSIK